MKLKNTIIFLFSIMIMFALNTSAYAKTSVTIKSISNISVTIKQGDKYSLPSTITAVYSDKSKKSVPVTWNTKSIDTKKAGVFTYYGVVKDYAKKVELKVTVEAPKITNIGAIEATIKQDEVYTLPGTVTAEYSDKTKKDVTVSWNVDKVDTSTAGAYKFNGTVKGYDKKVELKLTVISSILTLKEISKQSASVVTIIAKDRDKEEIGQGSGFITSSDGEVVTNYHVIETALYAEAILEDGTKYNVLGVLDFDKESDIAVLKLENAVNLPALKLGDSDLLEKADDVVAIGSPQGYQNTVSTGIISGLNRTSETRKGNDIQLTAAITSGSSGGALFNMKGQVVGITYAGFDKGNLGFAIPINEVKPHLGKKEIKTFKDVYAIYMPKTPTNVKATVISEDEIRLQWDKVEGAQCYFVYASLSESGEYKPYTDSDGYYAEFNWNSDYSAQITYIASNTTVYFKVTAVKDYYESEFSDVVSATTKVQGKFLPELSDVPSVPGVDYRLYTYDQTGSIVYYYYPVESVPSDFIAYYEKLMNENGWSYNGNQTTNDGLLAHIYQKGNEYTLVIIGKESVYIAGEIR